MPHRDTLRAQYRATRCFLAAGAAWQPLDVLPERTGVVVTAWNPGSRALTPAVNAARDAALARELTALDLAPLRARRIARRRLARGRLAGRARARAHARPARALGPARRLRVRCARPSRAVGRRRGGAAVRSVLFVCLGNICRSPLAEAALRHLVATRRDAARWRIDSAGTGRWHVGSRPDPRALAVMQRAGLRSEHRARQVVADDFRRFERVLAMDRDNLAALRDVRPRDGVEATLLGDLDPRGVREVADPFYGPDEGFDACLRHVRRCCEALLAGVPDEVG